MLPAFGLDHILQNVDFLLGVEVFLLQLGFRLLELPLDVVLLEVEQAGGIACHTGRESCFFRKLENGKWVTVDPVLKDPKLIYKK